MGALKRLALIMLLAVFMIGSIGGIVMFSTNMQHETSTLYVRVAAIYEGNADDRFYFTKTALMSAKTFIGDPVLMGHDWSNPNAAVGVITYANVEYDTVNKAHYIEMVFEIRDSYAAMKIKQGLFNKLSIGFQINKMVCPLDGKDLKFCEHQAGQYYNGRLARGIVINITGQEVSFVNVPASPNARVLAWSHKPFSMSK